MLNFSDISKTNEIRKPLPAEAYKNIKSTGEISREEAVDFWKNEFSQSKESPVVDIYDRLLSEIFNVSEDDLYIDFDLDEHIKALMDRFESSEWHTLSSDEKIDIMKSLIDTVSEKLGLKNIPTLEVYEDEGTTFGDYNPVLNMISVNLKNCDNPIELIDTLMHELRHAYQNERAELFETWQDALYRCNFDNYISPVPLPNGEWLFFLDYFNQYVEVDARAFASKFTEAMI